MSKWHYIIGFILICTLIGCGLLFEQKEGTLNMDENGEFSGTVWTDGKTTLKFTKTEVTISCDAILIKEEKISGTYRSWKEIDEIKIRDGKFNRTLVKIRDDGTLYGYAKVSEID